MAYKTVETPSPKVPGPDWTHTLENQTLGKGMYDQKKKSPATKSPDVSGPGFTGSGLSKRSDFAMRLRK